MRTIIDSVKTGIMLGERCAHFIVNIMKISFFDKPPPDSRLIRYYDCQQSGFIDLSYCLKAVWIDLN